MAYNSQYTGEQVDKAVKIANNNEQVADKVLATDGEGGIKYVTPESGTEVVANPTLAGTETDLTGLEVDGVKYKVPSGGSSNGYNLTITIDTMGAFKIIYSDYTTETISGTGTYVKSNVIGFIITQDASSIYLTSGLCFGGVSCTFIDNTISFSYGDNVILLSDCQLVSTISG